VLRVMGVILLTFLVMVNTAVAEDTLIWEGVTRVLREGQYANDYLQGMNTAFAYSVALMNFVNGLVSTPHHGYLAQIGQAAGADPEEILSKQAGICQHAMFVYLAIAEKIGLPARPVAVWYPEEFPEYQGLGTPGHATVEVFYGQGWHWFDPTWGEFYRKPGDRLDAVLSLQEVIALSREEREISRVAYNSLLWRQVTEAVGPSMRRSTGLAFLDFSHLRVESPYGTVLYQR
jgi:hypothetical protein